MNPHYNNGPGYPQGNPPPPYGQGESASYYSGAQQQQQQYPPQDQYPPQQQQYPPQGQQYPPQEQYPPQGQSGYGQPQQYSQQYGRDQNDGFQQDGPDGERGVLGALGGGVAGAVGGHKIGGKMGHGKLSTVLGAVAGAVAGHKLQDGVSDWKDNRDEEKEKKKREEEEKKRREEDEKRRREEQQQQQHHGNNQHAPPPFRHEQSRGVSYAGNFTGSSRDVRLDAHGEYMLHASCQRVDGSYQQSSISLNRIIENDQGSFRWASGRRDNGGGGAPSSVTVQPGDTLRGIAGRFSCSFEEIARQNGVQNPDMIYPGQVLQVPNSGGRGGGGGGDVGNFGASARDVRLADGGRRLEGELLRDGRWCGSSIVLDERIGNDNGTLSFN